MLLGWGLNVAFSSPVMQLKYLLRGPGPLLSLDRIGAELSVGDSCEWDTIVAVGLRALGLGGEERKRLQAESASRCNSPGVGRKAKAMREVLIAERTREPK